MSINLFISILLAHLFGNISIVQMLQDQYPHDYSIEQIDFASQNFPYQ
jgi:hypothetical protein